MGPDFATEEEAMKQNEARAHMARRLDCNPTDDAQWPREMIDRLIEMERQFGKDALARELASVLRRLDPYITR